MVGSQNNFGESNRLTKTELEEAGLETDNMAESTSQLQAKLLALTHGKVDIMKSATEFKNTTEILREMSAAWKDMTDIEKASALELMGGEVLPRCTVMCIKVRI